MTTNGAYHRKTGKLVSVAFTLEKGSTMLRYCLAVQLRLMQS